MSDLNVVSMSDNGLPKSSIASVLKLSCPDGEVETDWLRQKGVGIVYTRNPRQSGYARIQNRDINEIRPGVFLVVPPVE